MTCRWMASILVVSLAYACVGTVDLGAGGAGPSKDAAQATGSTGGEGGLDSGDAPDRVTDTTSTGAPADGRCGLTPRLVVAVSTFPVSDAGPVTSGADSIVAVGSDLYFTFHY